MSHESVVPADLPGMRTGAHSRFAALWWFAGAMAAISAARHAVGNGSGQVVVTVLQDLLPVLALLVGVRRHRPRQPLAWYLLAGSQVCFGAGDVTYYVYLDLLHVEPPLPYPGDIWYLAMYPLLAAGVLVLVRGRAAGRGGAGLLDALMVTIGVGMLVWQFLLERYLAMGELSFLGQAASAGYPLMDLLLLSVVARLLFDRGSRSVSVYLLAGGMLPLLLADAGYSVSRAAGTFVPGGWFEFGWVLYFLCLGAAALHPSMARSGEPPSRRVVRLSAVRFGLLTALPALSTPLVLTLIETPRESGQLRVVTGSSVLLWALAVLRVGGLIRQLRQTTEQNEELQRREADERFQRLIENSSDLITVVEADLTVRYLTPSVRRVLGYLPDELLGGSLLGLIHPDDLPIATAAIAASGTDGAAPAPMRCRMRRRAGGYVHMETITTSVPTQPPQYVLTTRDITAHRALEEQLRHQAFHDSLTGLANRALFVDRVHHAMARRTLADAPLAVLFLDLDDFKTVNDSLGHDIGDELLVAVAERLQGCLRPSDTPARLGGDEFAVLLEELHGSANAVSIADRILAELRGPFLLAGQEVTGRASVGIAMVDLDKIPRAEDLVRDAEAAMYTAKARDKGGHTLFTPSMHAAMVRKLALTAELRSALAQDQFLVHYQPIVGLDEGRIVGAEALVRWQHPTRGLVGPVEFIPLAEESGLIVPLGRWVLEQACAQAARWHQAGWSRLSIGVNVSLRQMQDPAFTCEVAAVLAATGLPPESLTLEITESFLAEDGDSMIDRLRTLKEFGVRLAIDDFGTGYSSLSRLRKFPIDILKIPKPFVDGLLLGSDQSALARTITDLARTLRMDVVAEGIEQWEQWAELRRMACGFGQGYFFARPIPPADIEQLLRQGGRLGQHRSGRPDRQTWSRPA